MTSRSLLKENSSLLELIQRFMDPLLVAGSGMALYAIQFESLDLPRNYIFVLTGSFLLCFAVLPFFNIYRPYRGASLWAETQRLASAWTVMFAGMVIMLFLTKTSTDFSRLWIGQWAAAGFLSLVIFRLVLRSGLRLLRHHGFNLRFIVIAGAGDLGRDVARRLAASPALPGAGQFLSTCGVGEPRSLLCVILSRWDIFNIKTILRGKQRGRPKEEISAAFVPIGELDEPKLTELVNQPDIKTVVDMLVTWGFHLSSFIAKALPEFMEKGDILGIERVIDDFYFEWALMETEGESENKQIMRSLIVEQIDFANIINTLKLLSEKVSVGTGDKTQPQHPAHEAGFTPGGNFEYSFLLTLSKCTTLEEALGLLINTKYSSIMEKAISAYTKTRKLSTIERFLEAFIAEKWSRLYRKDPLSISIIIGFLGRKLNEFMNLRIIARGKAHAVPVNTIKGELVFV